MLAYPGGLTWCRKPENSWKTTDLGWKPTILPRESRWLSGRVSDSGERSRVRNLPPPCCVLEQDTLLPESTGTCRDGTTAIPRKRWLRLDITEKLSTLTLCLNTNKQTKLFCHILKYVSGCEHGPQQWQACALPLQSKISIHVCYHDDSTRR